MPPESAFDPAEMTDRFYTVIKSLHQFDQVELRSVLNTLVGEKSKAEICYLGLYYRAVANIDTLLLFKTPKEAQAIAMIVRSLFEIAVDSRLLTKEPNGIEKMICHADVEKLRAAKKIVRFKERHPKATVEVATYQEFIDREGARIDLQRQALWPGVKASDLQHWSCKRLPERVEVIGAPFDQIYAVNYPQLSWFVHSGLTGILNMPKEAYRNLSGVAFTLAAESYMAIMADVIDVMRMTRAVEKIKAMMALAKMLPFTDGASEARALEQYLLSGD